MAHYRWIGWLIVIIEATDERAYMTRVVEQFREDIAQAANEFEKKRLLWHAAVVACEVTPSNYHEWHVALAGIALDHGIKATSAITTVKSARSKTGMA